MFAQDFATGWHCSMRKHVNINWHQPKTTIERQSENKKVEKMLKYVSFPKWWLIRCSSVWSQRVCFCHWILFFLFFELTVTSAETCSGPHMHIDMQYCTVTLNRLTHIKSSCQNRVVTHTHTHADTSNTTGWETGAKTEEWDKTVRGWSFECVLKGASRLNLRASLACPHRSW